MIAVGAHISTAKGLPEAVKDAEKLGLDCIQMFTRNPRGGRQRKLSEEEVCQFRDQMKDSSVQTAVMHVPYTVNLASSKTEVVDFGRRIIAQDLKRCHVLNISDLVIHPGNHVGEGTSKGIDLIVEGLNQIINECCAIIDDGVRIILEFMSGQGNEIGSTVDEMVDICSRLDEPKAVGYCLDTCHAFARGYNINEPHGLEAFLVEVEEKLSLANLRVIHLNDSKYNCGKRRDRHALLDEGKIGKEGFKNIIRDRRLDDLPWILEVPVEHQDHYKDQANLVRSWYCQD